MVTNTSTPKMQFPSEERFLQYCVSKRRTYLRQLFERRSLRGFYDLWQGEMTLAGSRFEIAGIPRQRSRALGRELRWLLLQDLHRLARNVVPEFPPAPPTVIERLPGALHQVRTARSMLIAGEEGVGKEQLAVLLHVLSGRPGALVRVSAAELGNASGTPTRQLMPERGSVYIDLVENLEPHAQEDLLAFLNGEARRRDLLFFAATRAEPRELVSRHGLRRDLFVRVSQTEVRLPPLERGAEEVPDFVGDIVYDLVRISPEELATLRDEAETLATAWRNGPSIPVPPSYDFFSEALSYVLWEERRERAANVLDHEFVASITNASVAGNFRGLCHRVAAALAQRAITDPRRRSAGAARVGERAGLARSAVSGPLEREPESDASVEVPTHLRRDELLAVYYRALLEEESGDLQRVAARAGLASHELRGELERLGMQDEADADAPPPTRS